MIPEQGQELIDSKLKMAFEAESEHLAEIQFHGAYAILDYAMIIGQLSPGEYVERRRIVELTRQRRSYK